MTPHNKLRIASHCARELENEGNSVGGEDGAFLCLVAERWKHVARLLDLMTRIEIDVECYVLAELGGWPDPGDCTRILESETH